MTQFSLFHSKSLKSGLHFTLDTSQFRLAKFRAIGRLTWLVATILEDAVLEDTHHTHFPFISRGCRREEPQYILKKHMWPHCWDWVFLRHGHLRGRPGSPGRVWMAVKSLDLGTHHLVSRRQQLAQIKPRSFLMPPFVSHL